MLKSLFNLPSKNINVVRNIATQRSSFEVRIPLSSGHMAGKWWGPTDRRPILALHGWQDNSGSFDRLIPLLPPHIPILAMDFYGHGFSNHLPPGAAYHDIDHCITIKLIKTYFGWKKISLIGHSMGGIATFTYGCLYPDDVDFSICLDRLYPILTSPKNVVAKSIENFVRYEELNKKSEEPPSYVLEEMVKKTHVGSKGSIDIDVAKYILYRNIKPSKNSPGRFYFDRDIRLKVGPLNRHNPEEILRASAKVTFPLLVCRAIESTFFGKHVMITDLIKNLKKSSKDFRFYDVPGTHHVHLNQPEIVSELITEFVLKHDSESRLNSGFNSDVKIDESFYPIYEYKKQILED